MPATLEDAIALAATHHKGQFDKAGQPYILHPLRVMTNLGRQASETQRIAAMLHDIVEDTDVSFQDLRDHGFSEEVVQAVDALTKRPNEKDDYMVAIRRVSQNEVTRIFRVFLIRHPKTMRDWKNMRLRSSFCATSKINAISSTT
jgi:guanosine-3',5'-bis(diphosphate) 3'-pyrophosphohydrolase